jgi:hypothetical protein
MNYALSTIYEYPVINFRSTGKSVVLSTKTRGGALKNGTRRIWIALILVMLSSFFSLTGQLPPPTPEERCAAAFARCMDEITMLDMMLGYGVILIARCELWYGWCVMTI